METTDPPTKTCPVCCNDIPLKARKCRYCGTFQNWRRYINVSASFLSLILAIISVSTVLISVLSQTVAEDNSKISASLVSWQRAFIRDTWGLSQVLVVETLVTNSGTRPGILRSYTIRSGEDKEYLTLEMGDPGPRDPYSAAPVPAQMIEPGSTLILRRHITTQMPVEEFIARFSNADLRLELVNFDGSEQIIDQAVRNRPPPLP